MTPSSNLSDKISRAFRSVEYPGDWCLRGSNEGDEPFLLEREFKGKNDWAALDPNFIDRAPDGLASALSFFSDEAFRFYLPAYLIADLAGQLQQTDVVFHLTQGLDMASRNERVNPRRYGQRTWFDLASHRFSVFDRDQAAAITAYLLAKAGSDSLADFEKVRIDEALQNYWYTRAA
jgi:hypothetical protein